MKKFAANSLIFACLLTGLCFFVGLIHISDEYIIYKTKGTSYEKIAWNLNLINTEPEKISGSTLFFGPSLIQAGICDSSLIAGNIKAINFGTNGPGNEVELFFLNKVLKYKPKKVYLHMFKSQHLSLHSMTPMLYDPVSLISAGQNINFSYVTFLFKRASYVLDYLCWEAFDKDVKDNTYSGFGVMYGDNSFTSTTYSQIKKVETDEFFESFNLEKTGYTKSTETKRNGIYFSLIKLRRSFLHFFNNSDFIHNVGSQDEFDRKAFELCTKNNLEVEHFYMPLIPDAKINKNFNESFYSPQEVKKITSLQNFTFLDSAIYWTDMTHLSKAGALAFTKELISQGIVKP